MDEWIRAGLILHVRSGSRAYGTDTPSSDEDSRGVTIPPPEVLLGLDEFEQWEDPGKDHVVYSLEKFARLALRSNPSAIEVLFAEGDDVLFVDELGARLLDAREMFLCRTLGDRYLGYAESQRRRLERHRRWLADPPTRKPTPEEHGATNPDGGRWRFPDADREKAYRAAKQHWEQYETWRAERNPARAELEARFGYDTKHALHLLRLLRMGCEVLERSELLVRRPDADDLRSVREGSRTYEELALEVDATVERLRRARASSRLPEACDAAAVNALVVELHRASLAR